MTCGALVIGVKNRESNSNVKFDNLFHDGMKSGQDLMTDWEGNSFAIMKVCWVGFCRESRWSRGGGYAECVALMMPPISVWEDKCPKWEKIAENCTFFLGDGLFCYV